MKARFHFLLHVHFLLILSGVVVADYRVDPSRELHEAVNAGDVDKLAVLIKKGSDIQSKTDCVWREGEEEVVCDFISKRPKSC